MTLGRVFWKVFIGNAVLMAVLVLSCVWVIVRQVDALHVSELTRTLHSQANQLRHQVADRLDASHAAELNRLARQMSADDPAGVRITFIAADGTVLGDSEGDPAAMEPHADRPEVRDALARGFGEAVRQSRTLGRSMKYVAVRVGPPESPAGVVRLAMEVRAIMAHAHSVRRLLWTTGCIALVACLLLAMGLARMWSQPIRWITRTAQDISRGDLAARARVSGRDELAELGRALNEMRARMAADLETIDRQRRMLEGLLVQLQEGVIVARAGRVVLMNPAAARLLGVPSGPVEQWAGQSVEACVAPHLLQRMLLDSGETADEVQVNLESGPERRCVLARSSEIAIEGVQAEPGARPTTGRLLVLTDVTQLAQAMRVQADFAANASHELRTPLAAIRAAVETLLDVVATTADACAIRRFAEVIDRHSRRMDELVRDLLNLCRLEASTRPFQLASIELAPLLAEVESRHRERAGRKNLGWQVTAARDLPPVRANTYLLNLVLDNLIDNAIKFTNAGGHVSLSARVVPGADDRSTVEIDVTDDGCGIAPEEQERVFERFYQVERARSGPERGTGLGLSIVRQAVAAMAGSVRLHSVPGQGTTVTVTLATAA